MLKSGVIKWYSPVKGYGFIVPLEGGEDVFFHYSGLEEGEHKPFHKGELIQFEIVSGEKGPKASIIKRITQQSEIMEINQCNTSR